MHVSNGGVSKSLRRNRRLIGKHVTKSTKPLTAIPETEIFIHSFQFSSVEKCLDGSPRSCPAITEEECEFHGKFINHQKANDHKQCQALCQNCRYPDCGHWSYVRSEQMCTLWELPNKNCISIGGSKEPSLLQCLGM